MVTDAFQRRNIDAFGELAYDGSFIVSRRQGMNEVTLRYDWRPEEVDALFQMSFMDLLHRAHEMHQTCFDPSEVQLSTLLSIKTGTCPENCGYCSQSGHHKTEVEKQSLMAVEEVLEKAKAAKDAGATRFCMGAGWRSPPKKDFPAVLAMVKGVKELGLQTCMTLGMLDDDQTQGLKEAGLDYYNHNLDTSPEYYDKVVTTRTYEDRLKTLARVRDSGMNVCSGGILGLGEKHEDRLSFLCVLANLPTHPQSVPINRLVPIPGTPLGNAAPIDDFDFVRTIACARIMMPHSVVRLSAGRQTMHASLQALCFYAGANSIFYGEELLTTSNPLVQQDRALMKRLGMRPTGIGEPQIDEKVMADVA